MKQYKLINNLLGWLAFAISATVYLLTVEPTASFWDCPEFITSAFKLEVGHPPGNTFFNMVGRFFATFAGGDVQKVALMVNRMSALCSAGTILFLFWTITHLTKALVIKDEKDLSISKMIMIFGSGMVGALVYTFTDTFWFSAVEGEIYAFSSFLTALVFWLILKWEDCSEDIHADKYIILLAYIIGISIGVHLLNLLCIPAVVLVYYFKKVPHANLKGTIVALAGSFVLIGILLFGMIPGYVKVSSYIELFFVNTLGFGYNTGTAFYFFFVLAILIWGVYESYRAVNISRTRLSFILSIIAVGIPFFGSGYWLGIFLSLIIAGGIYTFMKNKLNFKVINTALLSIFVVFIGYSSFAQVIIRSDANPPMDQNAPDNIFSFAKYLNREQYGDRPLFYGYTFVSDVERDNSGRAVTTKGEPIYSKIVKNTPEEKDRYQITGYRENYVYQPELNMLLPRMYSKQDSHVSAYKEWVNFKGKPVQIFKNGQNQIVYKPTLGENIEFFFKYQLNFMYWRYFMWNFSGRQNDQQSSGEITNGNWITGFNFIDKYMVGDQSNLPADMKNNKGRNVYYMMPLILGIIGLLYQAYKGQKGIQGFWVVFFLFFMTGIAIVIYLNQTPYQPRERDYAYAGSFYAFSIWIGMGVAAIAQWLEKYIKNSTLCASLATIVCLIVPIQMGAQNWDDHDRSDRYTARDFGYNYLSCVEENGIIFTNGDNDTFPLWYAQEVEGYRTDVRVCNLSYLQTDWYMTQMKSPAYESTPLPIELTPKEYDQSKLAYAYLIDYNKDRPIPLKTAIDWLRSEDQATKRLQGYNERIDYIPANKFTLSVDSSAFFGNKLFEGINPSLFNNNMLIDMSKKNAVMKNEIAIMTMVNYLNENNWDRPIYFATTVGQDNYMNLSPFFSLVGLAYQVAPIKGGEQNVNTEKMYDNLMNKFRWGGIEKEGIYLDENNRRMCRSLRLMFGNLIKALIDEGDKEKALNALEFCQKQIPAYNIPYNALSLSFVEYYYDLGQNEKGTEMGKEMADNALANIRWYFSLSPRMFASAERDINENLYVLQDISRIFATYGDEKLAEEYYSEFRAYYEAWSRSKGR